MVLNYDEIYLKGQYDVAVVVVRKEFMEKNPDLVEKFLREHEAATKEIYEKPQQVQKKINAELKQTTGKSLEKTLLQTRLIAFCFRQIIEKKQFRGLQTLVRNRDLSRNYLLIVSYTRLEKRRKKR